MRGIEQAELLPCLPSLIDKEIRQSGVRLYAEVPAHVIARDEEALCPSLVILGEAAIVSLLLQGICQHPIHTVEAVPVNHILGTVLEDIVVIMIGNRSLDCPGTVTVFSVAVSPILHLIVGDGVLQRPAVKGLMICHRDHFLAHDPISA